MMFIPEGFETLLAAVQRDGAEQVRQRLCAGTLYATRFDRRGGHLNSIQPHEWAGEKANDWLANGEYRLTTFRAKGAWLESDPILVQIPLPDPVVATKIRTGAIAKKATGAPSKHDWEGAAIEISAMIYRGELDPLTATQAEVSRRMADWFAATNQAEPADSDRRDHAKRLLEAFKRE